MELVTKILSWVGYAVCISSIITMIMLGREIKSKAREGFNEKPSQEVIIWFLLISIISVLIAIFGLLMAWHFGSM